HGRCHARQWREQHPQRPGGGRGRHHGRHAGGARHPRGDRQDRDPHRARTGDQTAGARRVHRPEPHPDPHARTPAAPGGGGVRAPGRRRPSFHVEALRAMGAAVGVGDGGVSAKAKRLNGARLELPYPSVGATETVLMSAVLAEGKTVLKNAATEPEVVELALFLQRMGARIELSPDRRIVIEGVERLRGATTWLAGDRIEAFSYLAAGLVTGGEVRVHGCAQDRLVTAITTLARMGARFDINDEYLCATAP